MAKKVKWDSTYDEAWAREVANWPWERNDDHYLLKGKCPICAHEMSHEFEKLTTVLRTLTVDSPEEESVWVTVRCNCPEPHTGRPEDQTSGCGKSVRLQVPVS